MVLLDSNIIIYLRQPNFGPKIVKLLSDKAAHTCNIVVAEVLGCKDLTAEDAQYFNALFNTMKNLPFDASITRTVIDVRRNLTIELPDAVIAATALVYDLVLWTHNTDDFINIPKLRLFDPISKEGDSYS